LTYPPYHPDRIEPWPSDYTTIEFRRQFSTETGLVEFKTGIGAKPIQESVVAFSNANGGVVLIGVKDDGSVVGRELTPGAADDLHRAVRDARDPGRYALHQFTVDGRPVIALGVARRVHGFSQTSDGRVLVAHSTRKDALFGAELQRFINERALDRFETADGGADFATAHPDLLEALRRAFGWREDADLTERLAHAGLIRRDGGRVRLTVAGALTLTGSPERTLGKAFVEIVRIPAGSSTYDRREEVRGPVDVQVAHATDLVLTELGREVVVLGLRRHELERIPHRVLREAVANAVAHRSYEETGRSVRIEVRPDAVHIVSPGGLPEPVTEANIRDTQSARNLSVIDVLRRFNLAEDRGEGVDMMEDLMRTEMLDAPSFRDLGHSVEVVLPSRSAIALSERAWIREIEARGMIDPRDRLLLVHAGRGEPLSNGAARELLGVDSVAARRALHRLRDAGFLVQRGSRAGTVYVLESSLAPPAGLRLSDEEIDQVTLALAQARGSVVNRDVRSHTGLDRAQALRSLERLVRAGRLRREGERRGTRYVPS